MKVNENGYLDVQQRYIQQWKGVLRDDGYDGIGLGRIYDGVLDINYWIGHLCCIASRIKNVH